MCLGEFTIVPEKTIHKRNISCQLHYPRLPASENTGAPCRYFYFSSFFYSIHAFLNPLQFQNFAVTEVRICARRSHIILHSHVEV
jgi:hypothetical protein